MKRLCLLALFVSVSCFISVAAPAAAQDDVLHYGDTTTGTITTATSANSYYFDGEAGDEVVIEMIATNFDELDTLLRLANADGDIVAENDDANDSTLNSKIQHTLTASGRYEIVATAYAGAGDFTLRLVGADSNRLISGQTAQGVLATQGDAISFVYLGTAGETITIDMNAVDSDELDTYLVLYDPDGELVAENDDRNRRTFDSQIRHTLQVDGDYTIVAMQFSGAGDFSLTLRSDRAATTPSQPPTDGPTITAFENTIRIGDTVNGRFDPASNQHILYFEGTAGQTVTITFRATSGNPDHYMIDVFDATITARTADDDTVTISATLLAKGAYGVYVLSLSPRDANRYTLALE